MNHGELLLQTADTEVSSRSTIMDFEVNILELEQIGKSSVVIAKQKSKVWCQGSETFMSRRSWSISAHQGHAFTEAQYSYAPLSSQWQTRIGNSWVYGWFGLDGDSYGDSSFRWRHDKQLSHHTRSSK